MKCPCEYGICSECQIEIEIEIEVPIKDWHDSLKDREGWIEK